MKSVFQSHFFSWPKKEFPSAGKREMVTCRAGRHAPPLLLLSLCRFFHWMIVSFDQYQIDIEKSSILQVTMISKKLSEMEEQQLHSNDERGRLRTENAVLTERVHVLEEQLLVAEQR